MEKLIEKAVDKVMNGPDVSSDEGYRAAIRDLVQAGATDREAELMLKTGLGVFSECGV